ncbi:hypothetical protein C8F01DRAFT_1231030 [Mycena amicta]|nr:hypothetical protein C8F01DRAFT_1231030 [Mycena amicta]
MEFTYGGRPMRSMDAELSLCALKPALVLDVLPRGENGKTTGRVDGHWQEVVDEGKRARTTLGLEGDGATKRHRRGSECMLDDNRQDLQEHLYTLLLLPLSRRDVDRLVPRVQRMLLPGLSARPVKTPPPRQTQAPTSRANSGSADRPSAQYWNNPAANEAMFVDGWLRTGDQFRVDEKGFFFFADRAKDTLKISGIQVSQKEIEDVLLAHPSKLITDVAVAGVSALGGGGQRTRREVVRVLREWHEEQLSRYNWLRGGIAVVETIPKTPMGKTLRRTLQAEYEKKQQQQQRNKEKAQEKAQVQAKL